jgi:galactokinase
MNRNNAHLNFELRDKVVSAYVQKFGTNPQVVLRSPGRINLIGEHTDYNDGFVMPSAVAHGMYIAAGKASDCTHRWEALDLKESVEMGSDGLGILRDNWTDFIQGAWLSVRERNADSPYLNLVIASDVPIGSGMSSSSALTCGIITAAAHISGLMLEPRDIPFMAFDVERGFVGLRGGIMDQYSSVLSEPDKFMLLDCQTNEHRLVDAADDMHLFLVHSRVQRKLTGSEYNTRSDECTASVEYVRQFFPVNSLRETTLEQLEANADEMDPTLYKRARYVIEENERVLQCEAALKAHRVEEVGAILNAGHAGMRDMFEISIPELDFIVERAQKEPTIYGARLMGGGFGGCAIHIAKAPPTQIYRDSLCEEYTARFGVEPSFINIHLTGGTYFIDQIAR